MSRLRIKPTTFAVLCLAFAFEAHGAPKTTKMRPSAIIALLKDSTVPLSRGSGDCAALEEFHRTLGKLVRHFEKKANGRKEASCSPSEADGDVFDCRAEFSNKVPPERSEEEFSLELQFQMKARRITALGCFMAG